MQHTQQEIDEMRQRVADGIASDDDRRLVKLYDKGAVTTVPEQQATPAGESEVTSVLTEPETYDGEAWNKDALIEECRKRDLAVSGNKDELAARLREFDTNAKASPAEQE